MFYINIAHTRKFFQADAKKLSSVQNISNLFDDFFGELFGGFFTNKTEDLTNSSSDYFVNDPQELEISS